MIKVTPLSDKTQAEFAKLFENYYKELDCGEDVPHLLDEYVMPDLKAGLISADVLEEDGVFAGFCVYQRDDIDNEFCLREGWGDIREIYVIPSRRCQGLGRFLLYTAEMRLRERGTEKAYCLPNDGAENFFQACGYFKTNLYNEEFDCFVYEKKDLNNKCK